MRMHWRPFLIALCVVVLLIVVANYQTAAKRDVQPADLTMTCDDQGNLIGFRVNKDDAIVVESNAEVCDD